MIVPHLRPPIRCGVIGGSGLYEIHGLSQREELAVDTPFGAPSGPVVTGVLGSTRVAFLARHGVGHRLQPTEINYRANVWALKSLGVERLLAVSAVGSLQEGIDPLDSVIPDQFIDRTRHRVDTFFGDGIVAHVSLADPVCGDWAQAVSEAARTTGARVHHGGTYVCMEGPQFSTRAESELFRSWGAAIIGMTNMQEVRLAREAELCFATLALVTDYDCWKVDEAPVQVQEIISRVHANAEHARGVVRQLAESWDDTRRCACGHALDAAIITPRDAWPADTLDRLGPIVARVCG